MALTLLRPPIRHWCLRREARKTRELACALPGSCILSLRYALTTAGTKRLAHSIGPESGKNLSLTLTVLSVLLWLPLTRCPQQGVFNRLSGIFRRSSSYYGKVTFFFSHPPSSFAPALCRSHSTGGTGYTAIQGGGEACLEGDKHDVILIRYIFNLLSRPP